MTEEVLDPMVALMRARNKYHLKTPMERFKKGDRIRAFAGTHEGKVGTIKKVNNQKLTMEWDDGNDGRRSFCDAAFAELLSDYLEARASAPPEPTIRTRDTTGSGEPETTRGVREWTDEQVEKKLDQLTVELVAMLRMCDNPNTAWKEVKVRVDAILPWHLDGRS